LKQKKKSRRDVFLNGKEKTFLLNFLFLPVVGVRAVLAGMGVGNTANL
jgi:hypothetical protein